MEKIMDKSIRWGILGTGRIARKFIEGLTVVPDARVVAVGSRNQDTADAFGKELNIPNRHGTYKDLAQDADVDIVYVSTPHPFHKKNSILCINSG
jgi:predicted dehydrogenase